MANTWGIKRSDRRFLKVGTGVGANVIPIQPGHRAIFPPKYRMAAGVSNNVFDISYFRGVYYPTINAPVDMTSDWFTAANINAWFVTRGATAGVGFDDLSEMPATIYSDGNTNHTLVKPKGNMITFGARQDEQMRCQISIVGADKTSAAWAAGTAPAPNGLVRASFADLLVISGLHGVTDFTFSLMNGLRPNPIIGEGAGAAVVEVNAGKPVLVLQATVDAAGTFPVNEGSYSFSITPPGGTAVTFACARLRLDNPDDLGGTDERVSQVFTLTNMSPDGIAYPLTVT
jgi:hypothetical protein